MSENKIVDVWGRKWPPGTNICPKCRQKIVGRKCNHGPLPAQVVVEQGGELYNVIQFPRPNRPPRGGAA